MKTQAIAGLIMLIFVMLTLLSASWMAVGTDGREGDPLSAAAAAEAAAAAVSSQPEDDQL